MDKVLADIEALKEEVAALSVVEVPAPDTRFADLLNELTALVAKFSPEVVA